MAKPLYTDIPNARPVVWPIARDFWATPAPIRYGVSVRYGAESVEITPFASGEDAWAAGVDALADLIAKAA